MLSPLVRKELRALQPFLALVLFFVGLDLVYFLLTEFPDQYPLKELFNREDGGQEEVSFILAFALASGLLVRERDEGTLAFLDALPLSRTRVFLTKVLLGLAVLLTMPLLDYSIRAAVYFYSRTSLETESDAGLFLMGTLLSMASTFVYFSLNLALSFLRRFSLLVLGLMFAVYLALAETGTPYVGLLNIFSLSTPVFQGRTWLIPGAKLAVQISLALVCLALSFAAFHLLGDRAQQLGERVKRRRGAFVLGTVALVVGIGIWIGLLGYYAEKSGPLDSKEVAYKVWPKVRATTERFQIIFPENQRVLAEKVIAQAEKAEGTVRSFLGTRPIPRIQADLAGSAPHTAGVAHWKKVQMDLVAVSDAEDAVAVLAHELTHVYIDHESGGVMADHFNSIRFFHEGLASYVEHRFFRPAEARPALRRPGYAARNRSAIRMEELMDDVRFSVKQDANLVYPLGEVFVDALVKKYGDSAPGQVIRAFARPSAAKDLTGVALWQDVLQSCGFDLSAVEDVFVTELDAGVAAEREFLNSLPRLRGSVSYSAAGPRMTASFDGDRPGFLVCRVRESSQTEPHRYIQLVSGGSDTFQTSAALLTRKTFWYQLGWQVSGASLPVFEPWVEAPAR